MEKLWSVRLTSSRLLQPESATPLDLDLQVPKSESQPLGERIADVAMRALHQPCSVARTGPDASRVSQHNVQRFHDGFTVEEPDTPEARGQDCLKKAAFAKLARPTVPWTSTVSCRL